jgi:hypothetical protein
VRADRFSHEAGGAQRVSAAAFDTSTLAGIPDLLPGQCALAVRIATSVRAISACRSVCERLPKVLHRLPYLDQICQGQRTEHVRDLAAELSRKGDHEFDAWAAHVADQIVDAADAFETTAHTRSRTAVVRRTRERNAVVDVEVVEISHGARSGA